MPLLTYNLDQLYSYSFALNPNWSTTYATQPEILAYIKKVASTVQPHISVRQEAISATWSKNILFGPSSSSTMKLTSHSSSNRESSSPLSVFSTCRKVLVALTASSISRERFSIAQSGITPLVFAIKILWSLGMEPLRISSCHFCWRRVMS